MIYIVLLLTATLVLKVLSSVVLPFVFSEDYENSHSILLVYRIYFLKFFKKVLEV